MGAEAYRRVAASVESARQIEYRLFAEVTGAMIDAAEKGLAGAALVAILDRNRRLWSALASDCGAPGNQLPTDLRAQIISISLWVSRHISQVARGLGDIDDLIAVNQAIMDGLRPQS